MSSAHSPGVWITFIVRWAAGVDTLIAAARVEAALIDSTKPRPLSTLVHVYSIHNI